VDAVGGLRGMWMSGVVVDRGMPDYLSKCAEQIFVIQGGASILLD
jgi:hypothetical protein